MRSQCDVMTTVDIFIHFDLLGFVVCLEIQKCSLCTILNYHFI